MKNIIAAVLLSISGMAFAATDNANISQISQDAFGGDLTNTAALGYSRTFTYDLGRDGIKKIGAVVSYGSATVYANTFTDGRTSSGTITIVSTAVYSTSICGAVITVNGTKFNMGGCAPYDSRTATKVSIGANVSVTAGNLCSAITHNTDTMYITTCTLAAGVINIVSVNNDGVAYALTTSTTAITIGGNMGLGVAATASASTDKITITGHKFTTCMGLGLSGTGNLAGLSNNATYFAIINDANTIQLSSTCVLALAGTAVDITAVPGSATQHTYTLTPLDVTGPSNFTWQVSNDDTNYVQFTSSGGIGALAVAPTSLAYDFSDFDYRYLRMNFTAPTTGNIVLHTNLYLKR